jgi:hypothetical protein
MLYNKKVGSARYSTGNNTASFYLLRKAIFKRTKIDKTTTWRDTKMEVITLEHLSKEIEIETKVQYVFSTWGEQRWRY